MRLELSLHAIDYYGISERSISFRTKYKSCKSIRINLVMLCQFFLVLRFIRHMSFVQRAPRLEPFFSIANVLNALSQAAEDRFSGSSKSATFLKQGKTSLIIYNQLQNCP